MIIDKNYPPSSHLSVGSTSKQQSTLNQRNETNTRLKNIGFTAKTAGSDRIQITVVNLQPSNQTEDTSAYKDPYSTGFKVKDPDEIFYFLLRKVDQHHYINPYLQLPKLMAYNNFQITFKSNMPANVQPMEIDKYVEIKGHPKGTKTHEAIVNMYLFPLASKLSEEHEKKLTFTPEEEIILDELQSKYISDVNLLAAVIEQALEIYIELLQYKLSLYGTNNIRFAKPDEDFDSISFDEQTEIYYEQLLDENTRKKVRTIRLQEKDVTLIKIQQEQTLARALKYVSDVLKENLFYEEAELKPEHVYRSNPAKYQHTSYYNELLWDPNFLKHKIRVLAKVRGLYPSMDLMTLGALCLNIYDLYCRETMYKPYNEIFIKPNSIEERFLRPIYGYLHKLALKIQMGKEGYITYIPNIPKDQNQRFKDNYQIKRQVIL